MAPNRSNTSRQGRIRSKTTVAPSKDPIMSEQPTNLALEGNFLRIEWSDGKSVLYDPIQLRQRCPCATCNSERSRAAADGKVPEASGVAVTITAMEPTGNYAYRITFSDGHSTGLFTLEFLWELGEDKD